MNRAEDGKECVDNTSCLDTLAGGVDVVDRGSHVLRMGNVFGRLPMGLKCVERLRLRLLVFFIKSKMDYNTQSFSSDQGAKTPEERHAPSSAVPIGEDEVEPNNSRLAVALGGL
ncbi:hypothetical protein R1flu_000194 [Riccia fluitans]|uniref:Uncharacterized protein n=1 Tax=Riccia fluitans TaxID=41844 RepID=A0ABD1Y0N5_9MARC